MKRIYGYVLGLSSLFVINMSKAQSDDITCTATSDCTTLGYVKNSTDCANIENVKCPFDESKVFCFKLIEVCEIGSILYSDKSCSETVVTGKTPIAVVFDANKRLAVGLEEPINTLAWGGYSIDIPALFNCGSVVQSCGNYGEANTAAIMAYSELNSINYPAAEFCTRYRTEGTTAGDWFLPSYDDLVNIFKIKGYVNGSLQLLGKQTISNSYYWSSTENSASSSWVFSMKYGSGMTQGKDNKVSARAVLAY